MLRSGQPLDEKLPTVSIIIVHYNGKRLIKDCLDSLMILDYPRDKLEILVVDNGSCDGSVSFIQKYYPGVRIFRNDINNYCRANNLGIKAAKGDYVALLNNDTKVDRCWLIELIKGIRSGERAVAAGSKVLFLNGKIQSAGLEQFPNYHWGDRGLLEDDAGQYASIEEVESVSNVSTLYEKEALVESGLFDEEFNMYMEDVDMNFRLRKSGYKVLFIPKSIVFHKLHGSRTTKAMRKAFALKNRLRFLAKHFPEKLPDNICGYGEIVSFGDKEFSEMLHFVAFDLAKYWKDGGELEGKLKASLDSLQNYRRRCLREQKDIATILRQIPGRIIRAAFRASKMIGWK